jgi:hypothetical protein
MPASPGRVAINNPWRFQSLVDASPTKMSHRFLHFRAAYSQKNGRVLVEIRDGPAGSSRSLQPSTGVVSSRFSAYHASLSTCGYLVLLCRWVAFDVVSEQTAPASSRKAAAGLRGRGSRGFLKPAMLKSHVEGFLSKSSRAVMSTAVTNRIAKPLGR